ncbi:MAG: helix-turn-helix domain-containing protein [SAR324 cluster bacterium]|nr:helix-turn-helix domain-containing protein [SAR324 cluster bacterium]
MRTIEVGAVKIHLQEGEEAVSMLEALLRPLSNKEVAAMIGISERTVMRWKQAGRLPVRESGQVFMVDLIRHLAPEQATGGELVGVLPDTKV